MNGRAPVTPDQAHQSNRAPFGTDSNARPEARSLWWNDENGELVEMTQAGLKMKKTSVQRVRRQKKMKTKLHTLFYVPTPGGRKSPRLKLSKKRVTTKYHVTTPPFEFLRRSKPAIQVSCHHNKAPHILKQVQQWNQHLTVKPSVCFEIYSNAN